MDTKYATFNRFEIELPAQCVDDCHHQGACDADVTYWRQRLNLQIAPELLKAELREYGAWDEEELSDHETNLERIIWLAAGNIQEGEYHNG